jgi:hypothetical protein
LGLFAWWQIWQVTQLGSVRGVCIGYLLGNWLTAIALPLGHLLACFSDCFTKQGVRVQELNQSCLNYQRQLAEYEQRLADQEYRITQFKLNLNNVENALASLS